LRSASGRNVAWLVLRRTLRLAACGVALGALSALWLGRVLAEQLHDISPADPITLAAVGLVLVVMAILATAVPLWHAARIDPAVALRES